MNKAVQQLEDSKRSTLNQKDEIIKQREEEARETLKK
jgi:hypothetical protein